MAHVDADDPIVTEMFIDNFTHATFVIVEHVGIKEESHVEHARLRGEAGGPMLGRWKSRRHEINVIVQQTTYNIDDQLARERKPTPEKKR